MYQKGELKSFDVFINNIKDCIDKLDEKSSVSFDFSWPCYNITTGLRDYSKHSIRFTFADKTSKSFEFLANDKMEESVNSNQYMLSVLVMCKIQKAHIAGTFEKGKYSKFEDIYRQINDYCYGKDVILTLKDKNNELADENYDLKDKVEELEDKIKELGDTVEELEDKVEELEKENNEQQEEIDELKDDVDDLQDKYSSLEERVAKLENE